MRYLFVISCLLVLFCSTGCKSATAKQCIEAANAYVNADDKRSKESGQNVIRAARLCPMACEDGDEDACAADEQITGTLCDLEGKEACQRICDEDKNTFACEKVKSM